MLRTGNSSTRVAAVRRRSHGSDQMFLDHLRTLHAAGVRSVVVAPIGFVSDHMEVVYDLDVEAQNWREELGMKMVRAATAGTHPAFVKMIRELMLERIDNTRPANLCAPDCCLTVDRIT